MAGHVDVGPIVGRVRVGGELHAVVAVGPAAGLNLAAVQERERLLELVVLGVVDQVAALDHQVGRKGTHGVDRTAQHLGCERLLGSEG